MSYEAADLERIERYAQHARNNAISIVGAVRILRSRPNFETRAEDMLAATEIELETSLEAVRKAMQEFRTKPVSVT